MLSESPVNFSGRWDEWFIISFNAEAKAVAAGDYLKAGWRAYDMGWVHSLRRQADDVMTCARRAATHWKSAKAGASLDANANRLLGNGYELKKEYLVALATYQEALNSERSVSEESKEVAATLNDIAGIKRRTGDIDGAMIDGREALRIALVLDDTYGVALYTGNIASLALDQDDWLLAESFAREALTLADQIGSFELIADDNQRLAIALIRQGKAEEAVPYAQRAVDIFKRLGSPCLENTNQTLRECEEQP